MSNTGLEVFEKTLQETNIWLKDICLAAEIERHFAWRILGAVLRATRDRLPLELAVHLGAQMPLLVRGAYYDQWAPGAAARPGRSPEDFAESISAYLGGMRPIDAVGAIGAVFATVGRHVSPGEVQKVRRALPAGIRALWPAPEPERMTGIDAGQHARGPGR
ncbi:MAG: DUF2267 domain-containing protein [Azospirillum sp.]|nr:DUF2267 domain-containing protein [Azospirillum sp.]